MYYIIYKTVNVINGRYYIGKHKTANINDGYLGSGVLLKKAIKRYGKKNFIRYIMYSLASELEMNAKEKELVTESVIADDKSYNIRIGGVGGFSREDSLKGNQIAHASGVFKTPEYKLKLSKALKGKPAHNKGKGLPISESTRNKLRSLTRSDEFKRNVSIGMKNSPNCKGRVKPRFTYLIQCPDGTICSTTHLKNWSKSNPDLKGINDTKRMNSRGYYIISKIKFE